MNLTCSIRGKLSLICTCKKYTKLDDIIWHELTHQHLMCWMG